MKSRAAFPNFRRGVQFQIDLKGASVRVFGLPGMVMIACLPALTSGGAVGLPLAAPPSSRYQPTRASAAVLRSLCLPKGKALCGTRRSIQQ
jgi:hypothetical protein